MSANNIGERIAEKQREIENKQNELNQLVTEFKQERMAILAKYLPEIEDFSMDSGEFERFCQHLAAVKNKQQEEKATTPTRVQQVEKEEQEQVVTPSDESIKDKLIKEMPSADDLLKDKLAGLQDLDIGMEFIS